MREEAKETAAAPRRAKRGGAAVFARQGAALWGWLLTLYRAHLPSHIAKQFIQNRSTQVAAALAYQTILSLVPLIVVGLSLVNVFGGTEKESSPALMAYLLENLIPVESAKITEFLKSLPSLSEPHTVGLVGVITLLLLSTTLLANIEKALNDIWRVHGQKSLFTRFTTYYSILTLSPVLLSLGIYQASQITEASSLLARALPFILNFIAFWVCYNLPKPKTRWRSTLTGAFIATLLFEFSKWGFSLYVYFAAKSTYANIYGAIGVLPLFLIWVYISWLIFLLGGQIAYSVQNIELLAELDKQHDPTRRSEELFDQATDEAAILLFYEIARAHQQGEPPPDEEALSITLAMPVLITRFLIDRFLQRGLILSIANGGFVPSRSPHSILVADLIDGLRTSRVDSTLSSAPPPVVSLLTSLRTSRRKTLGPVTFGELIQRTESKAETS